MKQKIVLKVQMNCAKCRTQALKIVAEADGVNSLGFEGAEKDKVVVTGEGVDAAKIATCLRKKFGFAQITSVAPADKKN